MIQISSVTKRYGRKGAVPDALSDASLAIPDGAVWAVVGPNGAGKSTLLSLLLGFIRPTTGTVEIAGEVPRDYLRGSGAGFLPERFSLPPGWRVGDALRAFARLERVDAAAAVAAAAMFGLEDHAGRPAADLSRGLLQRLGLAQALLARRSLIVLDEPTEGLDPVWRVRLRDIIAELRAPDRIIIIASHDLAEVERVADRAVVLDRGTVREVLDIGAGGGTSTYRIALGAPFDDVATMFPDAVRAGERDWTVTVGGSAELSQRLAALLAQGALVEAVEPLRSGLEERVRGALEGDA
jgi:ABC-type multidrug transport system ATPase subunit